MESKKVLKDILFEVTQINEQIIKVSLSDFNNCLIIETNKSIYYQNYESFHFDFPTQKFFTSEFQYIRVEKTAKEVLEANKNIKRKYKKLFPFNVTIKKMLNFWQVKLSKFPTMRICRELDYCRNCNFKTQQKELRCLIDKHKSFFIVSDTVLIDWFNI